MYYVYILLCADGSLYTGITNDLPRRLQKHIDGAASHYTRAHGAEKIIYTERKKNKSYALKREAQIKSMTRAQKIELIKSS